MRTMSMKKITGSIRMLSNLRFPVAFTGGMLQNEAIGFELAVARTVHCLDGEELECRNQDTSIERAAYSS
jgi:hypothetical protein